MAAFCFLNKRRKHYGKFPKRFTCVYIGRCILRVFRLYFHQVQETGSRREESEEEIDSRTKTMRITFKLIVSLMIVVTLAAFGFSAWQANKEEARLKGELEKRAGLIADGLKESLESSLAKDSIDSLKRTVNKFSNREKVLGVSVHDLQGNLVAVSSHLEPLMKNYPKVIEENINQVEKSNSECAGFINLGSKKVHAYSIPILTDEQPSHILTVFHDRTYILDRVKRIWRNSFWRALIQVFLISLTTFIIIYLNVMAPIKKAAEWIKSIRLGESSEVIQLKPDAQRLLGPLAREVTKMAKSLEMAKLSAEEEARLRQSSESLWTPERLREWVKNKLEGRPLFVVSNREPYMHSRKGKEIECITPASGLVTAIEPILMACGGMWVAHGAGTADSEMSDKDGKLKVPPENPQYTLKRVWLTKDEEEGYYYGFSNEGLWPLCHIAHTRPTFRPQDWLDYEAVNKKFAESILQELEGVTEPCVLIQDYHFALLPGLIKQARPDANVSIFWHIPWPNPESFGICPWQKEILQGMLGADIVGFHTQFHCNNFIETVDRFLESRIDYEHFTVNREGHTAWIKAFPISIAFLDNGNSSNHGSPLMSRDALLQSHGIEAQWMGVGVDRLDYTKGIAERFRGIEYFLDQNPNYVGKFTFVELGAPSRTLIPKYAEFMTEIEKEAERINAKFNQKNWKPVLFLKKHHSHQDILPYYKAADVCMVTSLHDGMNLVAKEFVASRSDEKGVLILSQFTGASRDLHDALIINPYDVSQTAEAIKIALEMSSDEQKTRMKRMRGHLRERNIYKWAADVVGELASVRMGTPA
jgi:trehalose 6-phosphate synthase